MDRETAVKLFERLNRGAPDGIVSGRVLEAFATEVERMWLTAHVENMERGIAVADARVIGAVAAYAKAIRDAESWVQAGEGVGLCYYYEGYGDNESVALISSVVDAP